MEIHGYDGISVWRLSCFPWVLEFLGIGQHGRRDACSLRSYCFTGIDTWRLTKICFWNHAKILV